MKINSEKEALAALAGVVAWASEAPEMTAWGGTTGSTAQRGRILATKTHDGTLGLSTYPDAQDAKQKALEMEQAYRSYLKLRDAH